MPKNLVLIHLESVSQMAFWQYSTELECLFELMWRSAVFSNFQAASTSSVMSMSDLLHGDSSEMDHLAVFPKERGLLRGKADNLFMILRANGYRTFGLQYGSFCLGDAPNNFWGVWPAECGQFRWQNDREEMHRETYDFLERAKKANEPFALYFWNMNTHLRDEDPLKGKKLAYHERFQAGYRLLDMSIRRLLGELSRLGVLRDTLVVVFGDHGDDLWRHGMYRGRSHIIDPFANVCWCPLFFHNEELGVGITQQMVSMIDLKATILGFLFPQKPPEPPATPFSGSNILTDRRTVAFAQSMFALQLERSDPAKAITKSYSITNGDFRLMVSTASCMEDTGGLEFFLEQWDYGDTRNLLDFCELDNSGNIAKFGAPEAVHPHFGMTFTPKTVNHLVQSYSMLRSGLYTFIREKEKEALKHFSGERHHLFPDEMFLRARKRT